MDGKEAVCRGKIGSDKGDCGYKETAKVRREAFAESARCHESADLTFFCGCRLSHPLLSVGGSTGVKE